MSVWFQHNKQRGTCEYSQCPQPVIIAGEPIVRCRSVDKHGWSHYRKYHINCYVVQGLEYLKANPYIPKRVPQCGRTPMSATLNPEQERKRFLLIRRRNYFISERKKLATNGQHDTPRMIALGVEINIIEADMESVGGCPARWRKQ
jgi:hypothetical protein